MNGRRLLGAAGLGVLGAVVVRVVRTLPLVREEPVEDGGATKKSRKKDSAKMDFKKKGTGPRTRRKKAKKGK